MSVKSEPPSGEGGREQSRQPAGADPAQPAKSGRARILVVDDSHMQADWLVQVLAREGYEVITAANGREAIRAVRASVPDLVLLDMILPDMDGLEVLRIMKAQSHENFLPVIMLSVKSDLDSRVAGLRIGADDFLAKPFAEAEIRARSAAMLRIKTLQDQLRTAKGALEQLSVTDGLTELFNRRHFEERLKDEWRRAERYNDPVSLIMLDLDHFKNVNDKYGHQFGDRVLRGTAEVIKTGVRDLDVCARYGGEEFAIILPKTALQGALTVANRIQAALRAKTYTVSTEDSAAGAERLCVTASIGIGFYPSREVKTSEQLVKSADEALYRAKAEGRNAICLQHGQSYRYDSDAH